MTEEICQEVVATYLKQLRLSRMARECEATAREAEQRGLGYLGFLQALLEGELAQARSSNCANGSKRRPFPTRNAWRTLTFLWCLASPRSDCWSWRKEPSSRLTTMCCSLAPAGLAKRIY